MTTSARSTAFWVGIILIIGLSALGLHSALGESRSAETLGQRAATFTQFGYVVIGLLAAGALLRGYAWARALLSVWVALIAVTGGLAPVVWGGAAVGAGIAAGLASAGVALLVVWLAMRQRSG